MGQVAPIQIVLFDQLNFPLASPILQLLLARDCLLRRRELFHMDEAMYAVLLDELRAAAGAMLFKSNSQIIGDADVERAVSATGKNVDVVGAGLRHGGKNFSTVGMGPGVRRDDE